MEHEVEGVMEVKSEKLRVKSSLLTLTNHYEHVWDGLNE